MALYGSKYNTKMQITIKKSCTVLSYELKWTAEVLSGKLNVYDIERLYTLRVTLLQHPHVLLLQSSALLTVCSRLFLDRLTVST